jgi:mono/diheme cytochrome c family protein
MLAQADGSATFAARCKMCHGAGGAMFTESIKGLPEAQVLKTIREDKGKMKAVHIDDDAVVKYFAV